MTIATSPAYQATLWLLFAIVVFGWSWYFGLVQLHRLAFALPRISVTTFQQGQARARAITIHTGHYVAIGKSTRAAGLHLITYGWLREQTK